MDLDVSFGNVSSSNEINSTDVESDTETKLHSFLIYLSLFGLPFGVLLVIISALVVIIVVLKNRKLKAESSKIFYVNRLVSDVVTTLT